MSATWTCSIILCCSLFLRGAITKNFIQDGPLPLCVLPSFVWLWQPFAWSVGWALRTSKIACAKSRWNPMSFVLWGRTNEKWTNQDQEHLIKQSNKFRIILLLLFLNCYVKCRLHVFQVAEVCVKCWGLQRNDAKWLLMGVNMMPEL